METAAPPEFGGPTGMWSPETLLAAAVADCFILTVRAIARAQRFDWLALNCRVEALLERVDGHSQFTQFMLRVRLTVPPGTDAAKAQRLLEQAEHGCLITNSLRGTRTLETQIVAEEAEQTC
jgi:organic hydroperoxide reductase OsmC/OhrA